MVLRAGGIGLFKCFPAFIHNPNSARRAEISSNTTDLSVISGCNNCHSNTRLVALLIQGPFFAPRCCMISPPFTMGLSSQTLSRSFSTTYARNWSYSWATINTVSMEQVGAGEWTRYLTINEITSSHDLLKYGQDNTESPFLAPGSDSESDLLPDFCGRGLDGVSKQ